MISKNMKNSPSRDTLSPSHESGAAAAKEPARPQAWWQWMLVYPTLAVSLLGSIPTLKEFVQSKNLGVPHGQSEAAMQQQDLWAKNLLCMQAPFDALVNSSNVQVDATICRSGDVLVRFIGPENKKSYKWVPVERFETRLAFSFFNTAIAQSLPQRAAEVLMCQWAPDPRTVVRRLRNTKENKCFNERIQTATGNVTNRQPVPCDAPCGR